MVTEARYSTAKELAAELRVTVDTVYDWAQRGEIPVAFRAGSRLRFDTAEVVRVLADREQAAR